MERHDGETSTCRCIRRDYREELDGSRSVSNNTRVTGVIVHFDGTSYILGVEGHTMMHFGQGSIFLNFLILLNVVKSW